MCTGLLFNPFVRISSYVLERWHRRYDNLRLIEALQPPYLSLLPSWSPARGSERFKNMIPVYGCGLKIILIVTMGNSYRMQVVEQGQNESVLVEYSVKVF